MVNSYENARFWLSLEGYGVETNVRDEKRLVDRCLPAIVDIKEKKEMCEQSTSIIRKKIFILTFARMVV